MPIDRRHVLTTIDEIAELRRVVLEAASRTMTWLRHFEGGPMAMLQALKFTTVGHDPLNGEALNVIEQINQTFTILTALGAVTYLLDRHPEARGFRLALTTGPGRDIQSVEHNLVAGEVFAATHPRSNQKLRRDVKRLADDPARHRYVFFMAPGFSSGRQPTLERQAGVEVHSVSLSLLAQS